GTEPLDVGRAGRRGEALRPEDLARPAMAQAPDSPGGGHAIAGEERQQTGGLLLSGWMVVEVTRGKRQFVCACRLPPAERARGVPAGLQGDVCAERAGRHHMPVGLHSLRQGGIAWLGHAVEAEGGARVLAPLGGAQARVLLLTQASESARAGSARRSWLRGACCSRTGGARRS